MFTEKEVAEMIEQQLNDRVDHLVNSSLSYYRLVDLHEYLVSQKFPQGWIDAVGGILEIIEREEEKEKNETQKTR